MRKLIPERLSNLSKVTMLSKKPEIKSWQSDLRPTLYFILEAQRNSRIWRHISLLAKWTRVENYCPGLYTDFLMIWIIRKWSCHSIIVSTGYCWVINPTICHGSIMIDTYSQEHVGLLNIGWEAEFCWISLDLAAQSGLFHVFFWDWDWRDSNFPGWAVLIAIVETQESKTTGSNACQSLVVWYLLIFH